MKQGEGIRLSDEEEVFRQWSAKPGPERVECTCAVLREALRSKVQVLAVHQDLVITFCPHVIAQGADGPYVLAFLVTAERSLLPEKFRSPRRWRWLRVADISWATTKGGNWLGAPPSTRPLLDGITVDLEVA